MKTCSRCEYFKTGDCHASADDSAEECDHSLLEIEAVEDDLLRQLRAAFDAVRAENAKLRQLVVNAERELMILRGVGEEGE